MVRSRFLQEMFTASYSSIKEYSKDVTHTESIWQPPFGGNSINWIMGHLVVSRCNFLMLLDVPSIWSMDQCLRFIPGSVPVTEDANSVPYDTLLIDFGQTQVQLIRGLGPVNGSRAAADQGREDCCRVFSLLPVP